MTKLTIKCTLRAAERFETVFGVTGGNKRLGSYHGSYFNMSEYDGQRWPVTLIIQDAAVDKYLGEGLSEIEIIEACLEYLNTPVGKRKKYQPYGKLEMYRAKRDNSDCRFFIQEDENDKKIIKLLAVTDQRKNKFFWGKGKNWMVSGRKKRKK